MGQFEKYLSHVMLACRSPACHIQGMGRAKRPRDTNQLAKLIVDVATGEVKDKGPEKAKGQRKGGLNEGRRGSG